MPVASRPTALRTTKTTREAWGGRLPRTAAVAITTCATASSWATIRSSLTGLSTTASSEEQPQRTGGQAASGTQRGTATATTTALSEEQPQPRQQPRLTPGASTTTATKARLKAELRTWRQRLRQQQGCKNSYNRATPIVADLALQTTAPTICYDKYNRGEQDEPGGGQ